MARGNAEGGGGRRKGVNTYRTRGNGNRRNANYGIGRRNQGVGELKNMGTNGTKRRRNHNLNSTVCGVRAMSSENQGGRDEDAETASTSFVLPIFPLSLVALPDGMVPLHIFEARYRVLFNTLLAGEAGIDEDMVDDTSPFKATKKFGISCVFERGAGGDGDPTTSSIASVGTVMSICEHHLLEDGQMDILSEGKRRYKILEVVKEKPVLLCRVQEFDDDDDAAPSSSQGSSSSSSATDTEGSGVSDTGDDENAVKSTKAHADEVRALFVELMNMASRLKGKTEAAANRADIPTDPGKLSFFLSSLFERRDQKQALIEVTSTRTRLDMCRNVLEESLKVYSAATAIQGAFGEGGGGDAGGVEENEGVKDVDAVDEDGNQA